MAIKRTLYVSVQDAIKLHVLLMREWQKNRFGIDCKDLLESALNRPKQAANFENADLIRQAAMLCFGLVKTHPWLGGNKRTATFLMEIFLERNGFETIAADEETYEMILKVESDIWKVDGIENWLRGKVRRLKNA